MNALRIAAQTNFENQSFEQEGSAQSYTVITAGSSTAGHLRLSEHGAVLSEIQHLADSGDAPLYLVKVMFQRPVSDHIFMSTPDECQRLLELFKIDTYALGLVATDSNGFHCLGENAVAQTTSYYLQCSAFKIVWSYSHVTGHIRAIAFCIDRAGGRLGFEAFKTSLRNSGELLLHPLILPLACLAQTIDLTNNMLRKQYGRCHELESTIGYHPPQRVLYKATQDLGELADMSKQANGLKLEAAMLLRRIKQLATALDIYGEMDREHRVQGLKGEAISTDVSSSIALTLSLTKTKLNVMELEFLYVGTRADSLFNTIFHLMTRNDTLATIELTRATARDSSSMKVVAVMTMAFLPGTFIAALFSIPSLQWNTSSVVQDKFWVYWAFTLPLTALVFALWMMLTQAKELVKWWTLFQKTHGLRLTPQDNDFKTKGKDSSGLGSGLNQQLTSTSTPSRPGYKTWDV